MNKHSPLRCFQSWLTFWCLLGPGSEGAVPAANRTEVANPIPSKPKRVFQGSGCKPHKTLLIFLKEPPTTRVVSFVGGIKPPCWVQTSGQNACSLTDGCAVTLWFPALARCSKAVPIFKNSVHFKSPVLSPPKITPPEAPDKFSLGWSSFGDEGSISRGCIDLYDP